MRVAARSIAIGGEREAALHRVLEAVDAAASDEVELLVLPELCLSGVAGDAELARDLASELAERGIDDLAEAVASAGVSVVVGGYALRENDVVNRAELLTSDGRRVPYDKIHRFDALGAKESDLVEAGAVDEVNLAVTELHGFGVGQATCFDLRFPELAGALAVRGAELLAVGAAWYDGPGKADQLELVARARAVDVGAYVVVAAAVGAGLTGESMLIGPDGHVIDRGHAVTAELDVAVVREQRAKLPLGELRQVSW